jgi:hypothetical protein
MTDKDAMKLALFALDIVKMHYTQSRHVNEAITALKKRLAQPEQKPVGEFGWAANIPNTIGEVHWKNGSPPIGTMLFAHPPQRTEQNFCSRCGKRTKDIHTCTPPKENT